MKQKYLCIKDWKIDSGTYFRKDEYYKGAPFNNGESVKMFGLVGMTINFHKGSDYFHI
ncbi:hypothetical protein HUB98_05485 [Paenibacillus barcinonensis]|uniref:Uncharacterized protein n=1 Tax=Paenibacillus barcinonensis TaxID=198119 RepID=A0A2V4VNM7_PAEBA|nr:hypothetical protein [Paenibacillus barcinonensis]PYE51441.1 hypothetical protein DFQ00_102235 [Paenibacillus barcinonensis]QKS55834.1 hypothetical protein HUB98_05485 [Paenibacillus barcinonensis]